MKREISHKEKNWARMWDAWKNNKLKEPIEQLCSYDTMMHLHGHYEYFESFENDEELEREFNIVYCNLPTVFADNLEEAYRIYMANRDNIRSGKVDSVEEENIFLKVDEFYYNFGERHIYSNLLDYALVIDRYIK